jgi:hypothetical protein
MAAAGSTRRVGVAGDMRRATIPMPRPLHAGVRHRNFSRDEGSEIPMRRLTGPLASLLLLAVLAPAASAAPPTNDLPQAAGPFEPYNAKSGVPGGLQAVADLAEATADPGVPRCLGKGSFDRTAWFRLDVAPTPRELSIDAIGRTTDTLDVAAFVQPSPTPLTSRPNACAGYGVGGADATEDRASEVSLRVPAWHGVLIQVARRGPAGIREDEQALVTVIQAPLPVSAAPLGDSPGDATPRIPRSGLSRVALGGATTAEDEPAQPTCHAIASVWRRLVLPKGGRRTITVDGAQAGSISVYTGRRPSSQSQLDCVDREGSGPLELPVRLKRRKLYWLRVGTDRPAEDAIARVNVRPPEPGDTRSGGGCLPKTRSQIGGQLLDGALPVKRRNRQRTLTLGMRVTRGPVCSARLELRGPKNRVYARGDVPILRGKGQRVVLRRTRKLVRGRYRLRVQARGLAGVRTTVRSKMTVRLAG